MSCQAAQAVAAWAGSRQPGAAHKHNDDTKSFANKQYKTATNTGATAREASMQNTYSKKLAREAMNVGGNK
jgi:hypothetical protein